MIDLAANAPAFDPRRAARRGHVESWFIKLNSTDGQRAVWFKWTLFAEPGAAARAECWAVVFARGHAPRGVKRSTELAPEAMLSREPFGLAFDPAQFDGTRARGELAAPRVTVAWDFALEPRVPALRYYPFDWLYRAPVPDWKMASPVADGVASGSITVDGERIDVTGWRAMQGHNWGLKHNHRYAWVHAGGFDEADDVVFEGGSGRLLRAGVELPWLTLAYLWIDGGWVRFDRPQVIARAETSVSVMRWTFATAADGYRIRGEAHADARETAGLHYANPGAPLTYCLNSKLAHLTLTVDTPAGAHRVLRTNRAALELGWPSADHGITMIA